MFAAGLLTLSLAQGVVVLMAAWMLLGIGMGMGLYEAAFATLGPHLRQRRAKIDHGHHADRRLRQHARLAAHDLAGSKLRLARRVQVWAAIHVVVALPLNLVAAARDADAADIRIRNQDRANLSGARARPSP